MKMKFQRVHNSGGYYKSLGWYKRFWQMGKRSIRDVSFGVHHHFGQKKRSSDSPIKMEVLMETSFIHTGFFIATFDYWRRIFWKCATFNQSCQWVRIGPILAALGHMVDQIKEVTLLTSLVFGSKHPTQFSSSRTTRAVMQGKGHATMGFATIKWTTCNPKWPNNGIFSNVQLALIEASSSMYDMN